MVEIGKTRYSFGMGSVRFRIGVDGLPFEQVCAQRSDSTTFRSGLGRHRQSLYKKHALQNMVVQADHEPFSNNNYRHDGKSESDH